jgi:hypothetical protein
MGQKSSTSSSLIFEESEQNDSLMEQIFDGISDVPDKEPALEISVSKSSTKKNNPQQALFPDQMRSLTCTAKRVKKQS